MKSFWGLLTCLLMASRRGGKCQTLTGKTFLLFTDERTWSDAWKVCNSMDYRLLHVDSSTTLKALAALVKSSSVYDKVSDSIWIGLSKEEDSRDNFQWDDCKALNSSFTKWQLGEPRDQDTNSCVYMETATFLWRADSCNNQHQYLCEKDTGACNYTYDTATCQDTLKSSHSNVQKQEDCEKLCNTNMKNGNFCWMYKHTYDTCTLYFDEDPFRCINYTDLTITYGFRKCFSLLTQTFSGTSTSASTSAAIADAATTTTPAATTDDASATTTTTATTSATTTTSPPTTDINTFTVITTTATVSTPVTFATTTTAATGATTTTSTATTTTAASATVTTSSVTTTATTASDKSSEVARPSSSTHTSPSDSTTANPTITSPTDDGATTIAATGTSAVTNIVWQKPAANITPIPSTTSAPALHKTFVTVVHADTTVTSTVLPSLTPAVFTSSTSNADNSIPTSSGEPALTSTAIVTSQIPKAATSSNQSGNISCPCMACIPVRNMTLMDDFVKDMIDSLKVDQSTLSSKRRMHESEPDDRPSAQAIGCGGTLFLVFTLSIVVMVDLSRLCQVRNKRIPERQKKNP